MRLVITAVINVVCYRGIVDSTNVWLFDVHIYAMDTSNSTLYLVDDKIKIFKDVYGEFMLRIELLFLFFSDKLGANKVEHWKNVFF